MCWVLSPGAERLPLVDANSRPDIFCFCKLLPYFSCLATVCNTPGSVSLILHGQTSTPPKPQGEVALISQITGNLVLGSASSRSQAGNKLKLHSFGKWATLEKPQIPGLGPVSINHFSHGLSWEPKEPGEQVSVLSSHMKAGL